MDKVFLGTAGATGAVTTGTTEAACAAEAPRTAADLSASSHVTALAVPVVGAAELPSGGLDPPATGVFGGCVVPIELVRAVEGAPVFLTCGVLTFVTADAAVLPAVLDFPPLFIGQSFPCAWGGGLVKATAGLAVADEVPRIAAAPTASSDLAASAVPVVGGAEHGTGAL